MQVSFTPIYANSYQSIENVNVKFLYQMCKGHPLSADLRYEEEDSISHRNPAGNLAGNPASILQVIQQVKLQVIQQVVQ